MNDSRILDTHPRRLSRVSSDSETSDTTSDSGSSSSSEFSYFKHRPNYVRPGEIFGKDYGPQWATDVTKQGVELEYVMKHLEPSDFPNYSSIADLGPESDLEEYHQRFQRHSIHEVKGSELPDLIQVIRNFISVRSDVPEPMKPLLLPVIDKTMEQLSAFKRFIFSNEAEQATAGAQDKELYMGGPTSLKTQGEELPGDEGTEEDIAREKQLAVMVAEEH